MTTTLDPITNVALERAPLWGRHAVLHLPAPATWDVDSDVIVVARVVFEHIATTRSVPIPEDVVNVHPSISERRSGSSCELLSKVVD